MLVSPLSADSGPHIRAIDRLSGFSSILFTKLCLCYAFGMPAFKGTQSRVPSGYSRQLSDTSKLVICESYRVQSLSHQPTLAHLGGSGQG